MNKRKTTEASNWRVTVLHFTYCILRENMEETSLSPSDNREALEASVKNVKYKTLKSYGMARREKSEEHFRKVFLRDGKNQSCYLWRTSPHTNTNSLGSVKARTRRKFAEWVKMIMPTVMTGI